MYICVPNTQCLIDPLCIGTLKHGCYCVELYMWVAPCVCPSHVTSCPTSLLDCVHASVNVCTGKTHLIEGEKFQIGGKRPLNEGGTLLIGGERSPIEMIDLQLEVRHLQWGVRDLQLEFLPPGDIFHSVWCDHNTNL